MKSPVRLKLVAETNCGNGPCPALYETENGTIVVQGFQFDPALVGLELPPGEMVVEIPKFLLERALKK